MRRFALFIVLLFLCAGCTVGRGTGVFPPLADTQATPPMAVDDNGRDYRILVANSLGETLSLVRRSKGTWTVEPDAIDTGQAPNQIAVRSGRCYVVSSLSNTIQIVDAETLATLGEISTGAGTNPVFMDFIDDTTAMVSCYLSNEVLMVDLADGTLQANRVIARIPMPSPDDLPHDPGRITKARPGGLAVIGDKCFVACANLSMVHVAGGPGVLAEIDIPSRSIVATKTLSGRDTTGILHSERFPDRLVIISAGDYVTAEGFQGNGTVESLNLESGEIFQAVKCDGAPFAGAIGPDDILVLENAKVGTLLRMDLREGRSLPSYPLPSYGASLSYASAVLPLPGLLCVTNFNADRLYLLEPKSGDILAELATGDGPDAIALLD